MMALAVTWRFREPPLGPRARGKWGEAGEASMLTGGPSGCSVAL
jgi:hypothetical protein